MSLTTEPDPVHRPPSPWPGSQYRTRHRWQLDLVTSLTEAATVIRAVATELTAAHTAGWRLAEPLRNGHLLAARASRRQRGRPASAPVPTAAPRPVVGPVHWRLRLVAEPPVGGEKVFDSTSATRTPVLSWTGSSLAQVSGPDLAAEVLAEVVRQVGSAEVARRRWGVAAARVGPNVDLVADGSALRLHAVQDGILVRTREVLTFQHAADGARTLLEAAAAYEELARTADALAAAGGRLTHADDGFLHVTI